MKVRRLVLCLFMSLALVVTFIPMIAFGEQYDMHELVINGDNYSLVEDADGYYLAEFPNGKVYASFDNDELVFAGCEGEDVWLSVDPDWGWSVKSVKYSLDGQTYKNATYNENDGCYYFYLPVQDATLQYEDVAVEIEFESLSHTITVTGAEVAMDVDDEGDPYYYARLPHGVVNGLYYDEDAEEFTGVEEDEVSVYVQPDDGYYVDTFDCTTEDGTIDVDKDFDENWFSFEMPSQDVTVDIGIEKANDFSDPEEIDTIQNINVNAVCNVTSKGAEQNPKSEGLFKFVAPATGTYIFYSDNSISNADPVGRVLMPEYDDYEITDDNISSADRNFYIYFDADEGDVFYLQAITYSGDDSFNIGLKASDIKSIAFTPASPHYSYGSCTLEFESWREPYFAEGDKITVTKKNNSSTTYVYNGEDESFVNVNDADDALPGGANIWFDSEDDWEALLSEHAVGSTMTVPMVIEAAGKRLSKSLLVKFAISHDMEGWAADPPGCYYDGNTEYWHCCDCDKYFADEDGTKEIAEDSWVIPATHSWAWEITAPAGFLKNGSKIQHCTECGDYGSTAVVPGYAKYFVKGLKVKKGKKSFTVKLKKQSKKNLKQFNGYQIMYSTKADMSGAKTVNASKKAKTKKIKGLKKKTTYYVKVCSFTKKGGVTYYSNWSPVKKVKTK